MLLPDVFYNLPVMIALPFGLFLLAFAVNKILGGRIETPPPVRRVTYETEDSRVTVESWNDSTRRKSD